MLVRAVDEILGTHNPELAVICWSVAMLLVFAPLAVRQFRRKVLG